VVGGSFAPEGAGLAAGLAIATRVDVGAVSDGRIPGAAIGR
jgi:hypothetical protein